MSDQRKDGISWTDVPERIRRRVLVSKKQAPCGGYCFEWHGAKVVSGPTRKYGKLWFSGRLELFHRVIWMIMRGPIPDGSCVLHSCDNPPCGNPEHLFLGTALDNSYDKVAKGRQTKGDDHWARKFPERRLRGSLNGYSKLTAEQVVEIRKRRAAGESQRSVAKAFGIHFNHVSRITRGERWGHIQTLESEHV